MSILEFPKGGSSTSGRLWIFFPKCPTFNAYDGQAMKRKTLRSFGLMLTTPVPGCSKGDQLDKSLSSG